MLRIMRIARAHSMIVKSSSGTANVLVELSIHYGHRKRKQHNRRIGQCMHVLAARDQNLGATNDGATNNGCDKQHHVLHQTTDNATSCSKQQTTPRPATNNKQRHNLHQTTGNATSCNKQQTTPHPATNNRQRHVLQQTTDNTASCNKQQTTSQPAIHNKQHHILQQTAPRFGTDSDAMLVNCAQYTIPRLGCAGS